MFFEERKTVRKGVKPSAELKVLYREPLPFETLSIDELNSFIGDQMVFDVECYINYFLVSFRHVKTGKVAYFETVVESLPTSSISLLSWIMWAYEIIGFNSLRYDLIMVYGAISGLNTNDLKILSDDIIKFEMRSNDIQQKYGFKVPEELNHIDLSEVAPLPAKQGEGKSLKIYAARIHAPRLQDLPFPEAKVLDKCDIDIIRDYNINSDLPNTILLLNELKDQIQLRRELTKEYGQDVRSKSDAQIAEVVIVSEVRKLTGRHPRRATLKPGETFFYKPPEHLKFQSKTLINMLDKVCSAAFVIDEFGRPRCEAMQELAIDIAGVPYAMGIGGLHSREASRKTVANEHWGLSDIDVASYYPNLILNAHIRPEGMGEAFSVVYQSIVTRRIQAKQRMAAAKKEGKKPNSADAVQADSLKITANGTFGKLGSPYSAMYSASGMIQVTLTGQLDIIMLIEMLTSEGFNVVSGNTDGICVYYERTTRPRLLTIVDNWRRITNLETEETEYSAIYQRDVNNYIAIKTDGEVKLKGKYAEKGSTGNTPLSKNPEALVCSDALVAFLTKQTPIESTINKCSDIRRFIVVRNIKGGAQKNGYFLGKVVRYYYAKNECGPLTYANNGNTVAGSEGGKPLMDLPDNIPTDIDLGKYLSICVDALSDIGYSNSQNSLF